MFKYKSHVQAEKNGERVKHLIILFILSCSFFPLYMIVNISFKSNTQFFSQPWLPTFPLHFENWIKGWHIVGGSILITIFICISVTLLTLITGILASYFFGRYKMPGASIIWAAFILLMLMPSIANLIPLFALLRELHLLNTLSALIICGVAGGQVFTVYVLRNFIQDIPKDLFEAAQMDGASHLRQIIDIVVPMSAPILSTLAILRFIAEWNQFILPLIVLRDEEKLPISVNLYLLEGAYVRDWGPLMASYAIASIPIIIIFLFTMRLFVKGLSAGALKG